MQSPQSPSSSSLEDEILYDAELNRVLEKYDAAVKSETHYLLNSKYQLEIDCGLGPAILHVDSGISLARNFAPAVKLTCNDCVIPFDDWQWESFIAVIENNEQRDCGLEIIRGEDEWKITSISKWSNCMHFSETDLKKIIELNHRLISNRLEMLKNLRMPFYYHKFLIIIKELVQNSQNSTEDFINAFCQINPSIESYIILECMYFYKNKVLNDIDSTIFTLC